MFLGDGDLHDDTFDDIGISAKFVDYGVDPGSANVGSGCSHSVVIFPTESLKEKFQTEKPVVYARFVFAMFVFSACVFLVYDCFVTNRQSNTEQRAKNSDSIVQELFPGNVAAQLFETRGKRADDENAHKTEISTVPHTTIAELYPAATVLCKY